MHEDKMIFAVDDLFNLRPRFSIKAILQRIRTFPSFLKRQKFFLLGFAILWALPHLFALFQLRGPWLDALNFISGARTSLIKTDLVSLIGSGLAKSVILGTLISLFTVKSKLNFNFLKPWLELFKIKEIKAWAYLLIGLGVGVLVHRLLSVDGQLVNSFASILLGLGFIKGLDFIQRTVKQGFLVGVLVGVISGQVMSMTILTILGGGLMLIGLGLWIQQKYFKKAVVLSVLMLMFLQLLIVPLAVNATLPKYEDLGVEVIYPTVVQVYEPFEVIIKISNPLLKKHVNSINVYPYSGDTRLITSSLFYDKNMINYHGEDEIRFTIQTDFYYAEDRELNLIFDFNSHYDFQDNGAYTIQNVLRLESRYLQTTSSAQMDLPQGYAFEFDNDTNFVSLYSARSVIIHSDANKAGYQEERMFTITRETEMYELKPFDVYLSEHRPGYTNDPKFTASSVQALPDGIKASFGVSDGAYVTYIKQEESIGGNPPVKFLEKCDVVVQFALRKEKVIYLFYAHYMDGVYEGDTDAKVQDALGFLPDVLSSFRFTPNTLSAPNYPIEVTNYFIPDTEPVAPGDQENTSGASDEWVDSPANNPNQAGVIAITIASSLIAIAAAGLVVSGSEDDSNKEDKREKSYQLIISKSIGNKLKCDQSGTFYAGIYERIVEEDGSVTEGLNGQLSSLIQIDSPDAFVSLSEASMIDDQKAVNFMPKSDDQGKRPQEQFTIRCRIVSGQGTHTENVVFALVEDPYIALNREKFYILNAAGHTKAYPITMIDFMKPVEKTAVKAMRSDAPFKIEVVKDKGAYQLKLQETGSRPHVVERFFDAYTCEIEASNDKEHARTVFDVVVCYEAVLPDFLGKPNEIHGYRVNLESEEMETTTFNVQMGLWNDKEDELEFVKPMDVQITFEDENKTFELIGIDVKLNPDVEYEDKLSYIAQAKVNLPALKNIAGKMILSSSHNDRELNAQVDVELVPDIMQYHANFEKEYQAAKRVIEVYMAERFRERKLEELEKARQNLGLNDLKLFRQKCWSIAEQSIRQEAQLYLKDAAWYDEAIATAELLVYIGDIAFDLALAPVGGPIAGFLAANVKNGFIEIVSNVIEHPQKSTYDIAYEFVMKRFEQTLGSADGLIEIPKANETKKLVIWLTCYVLYRVGFHWTFDKDEAGNGIGISLSIERAVLDFVGKGAGVLLGDFLAKAGQGRWPEKYSVTSKDQALVNENVSKAAKVGLDALDAVAEKADDVLGEVVDRLLAYINQLRA